MDILARLLKGILYVAMAACIVALAIIVFTVGGVIMTALGGVVTIGAAVLFTAWGLSEFFDPTDKEW